MTKFAIVSLLFPILFSFLSAGIVSLGSLSEIIASTSQARTMSYVGDPNLESVGKVSPRQQLRSFARLCVDSKSVQCFLGPEKNELFVNCEFTNNKNVSTSFRGIILLNESLLRQFLVDQVFSMHLFEARYSGANWLLIRKGVCQIATPRLLDCDMTPFVRDAILYMRINIPDQTIENMSLKASQLTSGNVQIGFDIDALRSTFVRTFDFDNFAIGLTNSGAILGFNVKIGSQSPAPSNIFFKILKADSKNGSQGPILRSLDYVVIINAKSYSGKIVLELENYSNEKMITVGSHYLLRKMLETISGLYCLRP